MLCFRILLWVIRFVLTAWIYVTSLEWSLLQLVPVFNRASDADRTAFEGVVRFLQKWSSPGPVQGLVVRSAVRSVVQKY